MRQKKMVAIFFYLSINCSILGGFVCCNRLATEQIISKKKYVYFCNKLQPTGSSCADWFINQAVPVDSHPLDDFCGQTLWVAQERLLFRRRTVAPGRVWVARSRPSPLVGGKVNLIYNGFRFLSLCFFLFGSN